MSDDVVLLCGGSRPALSGEPAQRLAAAGVEVCWDEVKTVEASGGGVRIVLQGRPPLARHALFIQPKLSLASGLAGALGAELTDIGSVSVDATGLSNVPGLFAAGDAGTAVQSVAVAAGSGARAAYAINAELALGPGHRPGGR